MKNWKLILPLMMSGSLIACTSTQTTQEPVEPESPKVEEPVKVEPEVKPDVDPKPEVEPKPEAKPEKKPEPKPKKPVKVTKTPDGMLILGSEEWVYVPEIDQTFKLESIQVRQHHQLVRLTLFRLSVMVKTGLNLR